MIILKIRASEIEILPNLSSTEIIISCSSLLNTWKIGIVPRRKRNKQDREWPNTVSYSGAQEQQSSAEGSHGDEKRRFLSISLQRASLLHDSSPLLPHAMDKNLDLFDLPEESLLPFFSLLPLPAGDRRAATLSLMEWRDDFASVDRNACLGTVLEKSTGSTDHDDGRPTEKVKQAR